MEILLIEDNEHKKARIEKLLTQALIKPVLSFASSVQEGLKFLRNRKPDLILLDMSLPVFNYSVSLLTVGSYYSQSNILI